MKGFKYPTVNGEQFFGCGYYRVSEQPPAESEEAARPFVKNAAKIIASAIYFAPELDITKNKARIYDKKGLRPGESQGLAYFLALILLGRHLREPFRSLEGDIWCTGAIDPEGPGRAPLLTEVFPGPFDAKLQAFLSVENYDKVFLVPTANITTEHSLVCENLANDRSSDTAQIIRLPVFQENLLKSALTELRHKFIVTVHAHELSLLVETLFEFPPVDPDREIEQWFDTLNQLHEDRQISNERFREVLSYAACNDLSGIETRNELLQILHTPPLEEIKRRLYLKSTVSSTDISKIKIKPKTVKENYKQWAEPTLGIQQVLVAMHYGLPMRHTVFNTIPFILLPSGTVRSATVIKEPYYLAQIPLSLTDLDQIRDSQETTQGAHDARQYLSLSSILLFLDWVNERLLQLDYDARFVMPSYTQWNFAVKVGANELDFKDLWGSVDQCCHYRDQSGEIQYTILGHRNSKPKPWTHWEMELPSLRFRPIFLPQSSYS